MERKRASYSSGEKFHIALEATRGDMTLSELSSKTGVHSTQIGKWKKELLENGRMVFEKGNTREEKFQEKEVSGLYEQIGRLNMEVEWLKKKAARFSGVKA